jgi:PAS domain S-box-containing protein
LTTFYFNPYALISFSSFLIMLMLGFLLRFRYYSAQTRYVTLLLWANAIYSFFYSFEISFRTLREIIWFYRLEYFGIAFLASCFLLFALQFSGKSKWLTTRNQLLILLIPVITIVLVFTNEYHHFFYREEKMNLSGPFPAFSFVPAFWYFIQQGYVIVLMLFSLFMLGRMVTSTASIYRRQILFLLLAAIFPFAGYLAYQLHLVPYGIDPVSFTFTLTGITVFVALSNYKLFDLQPIARSILFEKTQDGVLVLDQNNRLVDYNTNIGLKLKLTKKELGKSTQELNDHWPELMQFTQEHQHGKLVLSQNINDKKFFYNIHLLELENSEKISQGKLVVIRDISDLTNTEHERQSTATKLDAVIHAMPDMLFVIDNKGVFTDFFVSDSEKLFLNKDEVLGASLRELFNPEEAEILMEMLNKCLISDTLTTFQYEMNFPGTLKYYETRISRLDSNSALVIVRDVSESHEMKQDLLYQSGFQNILMNLASSFIHITSTENDLVINDSLKQIGEYIGVERCCIFLYDFENHNMTNSHEWCAPGMPSRLNLRKGLPISSIGDWPECHLKGETTMVENLKLLNPNSAIRNLFESMGIRTAIAIPMISQKNCLGFVGFESLKDNRKWADSEISLLKIFTGMLANVLEKITIEKSLSVARIKAEASNKLKTAFMNNISHEIRTPLNGIIGFGEIIANEQLSMDEKSQFLSVVQESSQRLMQTIDDYLDISMLVTGNQEINLSTFNIAELIEKVVKEFSELGQTKHLSVVSEIPAGFRQLTIHADYELILKIFIHLVGNSIKFTDEGSICIGLNREDNNVLFYVKDTGIGIAEDALDFVFDSFMQEDFSSTRAYQGSGLGLAIVKGIVTLLGGEINLSSTKGKGTVFHIKLPLATDPAS